MDRPSARTLYCTTERVVMVVARQTQTRSVAGRDFRWGACRVGRTRRRSRETTRDAARCGSAAPGEARDSLAVTQTSERRALRTLRAVRHTVCRRETRANTNTWRKSGVRRNDENRTGSQRDVAYVAFRRSPGERPARGVDPEGERPRLVLFSLGAFFFVGGSLGRKKLLPPEQNLARLGGHRRHRRRTPSFAVSRRVVLVFKRRLRPLKIRLCLSLRSVRSTGNRSRLPGLPPGLDARARLLANGWSAMPVRRARGAAWNARRLESPLARRTRRCLCASRGRNATANASTPRASLVFATRCSPAKTLPESLLLLGTTRSPTRPPLVYANGDEALDLENTRRGRRCRAGRRSRGFCTPCSRRTN